MKSFFLDSFFQNRNITLARGFTLIELVVAFSLLMTASVISIVGFRQFSDTQTTQNAALDVALLLQKARSRAQTQVKPNTISSCQTNSLNGYEVRVCNVPSSRCSGNGRYELHVICGNTNGLIEAKQLPVGVTFSNTTQPTYLFKVISGSVNSGSIVLSGNGSTKTIQVSGFGTILIQ